MQRKLSLEGTRNTYRHERRGRRDRGQCEPGEASGGDFTTTVWLLSLGAMTAPERKDTRELGAGKALSAIGSEFRSQDTL